MLNATRKTLIKGGRLLDLDEDLDQPPQLDILVDQGAICSVGPSASTATGDDIHVIDATDQLLIPGLVNTHYHSHDTLLRGMFEQLPLDAWMLYSGPGQFPHFSREIIETRTLLGAAECLLNGITTTQDMVSFSGNDQGHVEQLQQAYEAAKMRAVLAVQISDRAGCDCVAFWDSLPDRTLRCLPAAPDSMAQLRFVEHALERSSNLVSWGLGPSAPQRCSAEMLTRIAQLSTANKLHVFTHTYEARSQAVLARLKYPQGSLIEHLDRNGLLNERLTIAHGVWITESEIARLGKAKASLACNPISNLKLLNGFAPITRYATSGVTIGLGCDNCSGNDSQNLFEAMKVFALMWGMYSGHDQTSAAKESFKAATIGAARAIGLGDKIGLIRPGYRADLVAIDSSQPNYRPLNSAIRQIVYGETGRSVSMVMVDGVIVVDGGRLTSSVLQDLKIRAERARDELAPHIRNIQERNAALLPDLFAAYEQANCYPLEFDRFSLRTGSNRDT